MMRNICVVVASRANYGRIKTVLQSIEAHPDLNLQLVVGASALLDKYGNASKIMKADGFEPDATVYMVLEGENLVTMTKSTGIAIVELASVFERLRPDVVLTVADRYETMATAVAASYMNIPVAHTQGGEMTGSIDESVRHAVTKLSHIHFPATEESARRVVRMGENPDYVFNVGCPSIDIIKATIPLTSPVEIENRGVGRPFSLDSQFLLVIQHPVTTEWGEVQKQIDSMIGAIRELSLPTLWLWPNVDAGSDIISQRLRRFRERYNPDYLYMVINLPPEDFIGVLDRAACIVGNSSSALREGAYLGVPAVNVGNRQHLRERGPNVLDAPHDEKEIVDAIRRQLDHGSYLPSNIFGNGNAGGQIAEILASIEIPPVQKSLSY